MKKVVFLVGPTGVGKTDCSLSLSKSFPAEIVSADSMQVYRGLDIGTDKLDPSLLSEIPHHLIDILDPSSEFSVFDFREKALEVFSEIRKRKRIPLVVGGSGLYIKALTDGLAPQPAEDKGIRGELQQAAKEKGIETLHAQLAKVDPASASRISTTDERRIIRNLEIFELTNTPSSELEKKSVSLEELGYEFLMLGLMRERGELYLRVEERVDQMIEKGLLEEIRGLDVETLSRTARQAVGYKELIEHLAGKASLEGAVAKMKQNSRHLVKKQLTWFRKESRIHWFHLEGEENKEVIDQVITKAKSWVEGKDG